MKVGGTDIKWTTETIDLSFDGPGSKFFNLTPPGTGYSPIGWYDHLQSANNTSIFEKLQKYINNFRIIFTNTSSGTGYYNIIAHVAWLKE